LSPLIRCHRGWILLIVGLLVSQSSTALAQDAKQDPAAVRAFNAAAELQNGGQLALAAQKWANFTKKFPNDPRAEKAQYYLGLCLLNSKKYNEAAVAMRLAVTKYPKAAHADAAQFNLAMATYQIAKVSKTAVDFKKAAVEFGLVSQKFATSKRADRALYYQAESLYSAKDLAGAAAAYQKLVGSYPKSLIAANAYYALGVAQQELDKSADAAKTYQAFLADPTRAKHTLADEVRLRLGLCLFAAENFQLAEQQFALVAANVKSPYADLALLRQGQSLLRLDKVADATKRFEELPTKFPQSKHRTAAQLAAGRSYYQTEKYADAQRVLAPLAGAASPQAAEAAYWLGRALLKLSKPAEAITLLDAAAAKHAKTPFALHLQLARIDALYELPDRRKETAALYTAFAVANAAHELAPQARYMAAQAALAVEDFTAARTQGEAFLADAKLAAHPLRAAVLFIAAEAHLIAAEAGATGADVKKAQTYYAELIAKFPSDTRAPRALLRIGWCLHHAKSYDQAAAHLTAALAKLTAAEHKAEAQLLIGQSHAAAKRPPQAAAAYAAALAAKADWQRADEVLLALAGSLRAMKKPQDAVLQLDRLVKSFPNSVYRDSALYQQGEISQNAEKYDAAIAHYRAVLQKQPADVRLAAAATFGLGTSLLAKADYSQAVVTLTGLIAKYAKSDEAAQARYWRGRAQQNLKQYAPAIADLTAFVTENPQAAEVFDARYAMAQCHSQLQDFAKAAGALQLLLKDKPDYALAAGAHSELGYALLELKKPQEAVTVFRALATKWPDNSLAPTSWFRVGQYHEAAAEAIKDEAARTTEVGKAGDAYAAGLKLAKAADLREKLQYKVGVVRFAQGRYGEASKALQQQVAEHASGKLVGPARYLAAESLFREEKYAEAMPLFVKVVADKVADVQDESLYQAGLCAKELKNWPASAQYYKQLVDQFPKFEQVNDARYGLGFALHQQGKLDEASVLFEQITAGSDGEVAAKSRFMIGEIAFGRNKFDDAVGHFIDAAQYPYAHWQAMSRYEAGLCYEKLGQKQIAIKQYQVIVAKHAQHAKAADATKRIALLGKN
jgi:TolA-binding protein